ncbi:MAG: hypothetical protein AAGL49_04345 [Pseudomonadota bacterium]
MRIIAMAAGAALFAGQALADEKIDNLKQDLMKEASSAVSDVEGGEYVGAASHFEAAARKANELKAYKIALGVKPTKPKWEPGEVKILRAGPGAADAVAQKTFTNDGNVIVLTIAADPATLGDFMHLMHDSRLMAAAGATAVDMDGETALVQTMADGDVVVSMMSADHDAVMKLKGPSKEAVMDLLDSVEME